MDGQVGQREGMNDRSPDTRNEGVQEDGKERYIKQTRRPCGKGGPASHMESCKPYLSGLLIVETAIGYAA